MNEHLPAFLSLYCKKALLLFFNALIEKLENVKKKHETVIESTAGGIALLHIKVIDLYSDFNEKFKE